MRERLRGVSGVLLRAGLVVTLVSSAAFADPRGSANASTGFMGAEVAPAGGGLRVVSVTSGGPAERAGVRAGDVIVRARGFPPGSVSTFTTSVRAAGVGTTYPLTVMRGGRRVPVDVTLGDVPRAHAALTNGQPPPPLDATAVAGNDPVDLAQLHGRVVLVDFWASWCGPCRAMMPVLNRLSQRYAAQGLTVIGLTDESPSIARQVGSAMGIRYTLATSDAAMGSYRVESLPTMVLIDRSGRVRHVTVGMESPRDLEATITRLLAEPSR